MTITTVNERKGLDIKCMDKPVVRAIIFSWNYGHDIFIKLASRVGCFGCTKNNSTPQPCTQAFCFLLLTLHNGYQSGADSRHHITQQPLFNSVDPHPADDGQKGEHCLLGTI